MRHLLNVAVVVALLCSVAHAQILIPDTVRPHTPIVGKCDCAVPKNAEVTLTWRADAKSNLIEVVDDKGLANVHVWAPPGQHWLEVTVLTQFYRDIVVWVPDPDNPNDITKAKLDKIRVTDKYDIQRHEKQYRVLGQTPGPDPDPDPDPEPDPDPDPLGGFAGKVQGWAKDAGVTKVDLDLIGDNYLSIGSQGGDPARSMGWDLQAFTTNTKNMHLGTIGVDKLSGYKGKFFDQLAVYQSDLFKQRGLKVTDREQIAKLWTETGNAIKNAADAMR